MDAAGRSGASETAAMGGSALLGSARLCSARRGELQPVREAGAGELVERARRLCKAARTAITAEFS